MAIDGHRWLPRLVALVLAFLLGAVAYHFLVGRGDAGQTIEDLGRELAAARGKVAELTAELERSAGYLREITAASDELDRILADGASDFDDAIRALGALIDAVEAAGIADTPLEG